MYVDRWPGKADFGRSSDLQGGVKELTDQQKGVLDLNSSCRIKPAPEIFDPGFDMVVLFRDGYCFGN